ncbi:MAG: tyrosine-type recombinase/integrase, partial [Candidatus Cloacimonadales bacterium]|nr:tyrosine-type recombinase/integrase [Candidatus Cloacimonadales bacterium]
MEIKNLTPHNQSLLNNFQFFMKVEKGLSQNSVESYRHDVYDCLLYLDKKAETITVNDIIDFFVKLQELGLSSSSIARKRSALSSFYKFLQEEEIEVKLKFDDVPTVKLSQKLPDVLTVDEMEKLLDSISMENAIGLRNKAMLELMYASGLRISETINLSIHDFIWDERIVRVMGKGSKQRAVPIAEQSLEFVQKYRKEGRSALKKSLETDIFFLNRFGKKLSRMGVWKLIDKLSLECG